MMAMISSLLGLLDFELIRSTMARAARSTVAVIESCDMVVFSWVQIVHRSSHTGTSPASAVLPFGRLTVG
jgi:hypothetical protein